MKLKQRTKPVDDGIPMFNSERNERTKEKFDNVPDYGRTAFFLLIGYFLGLLIDSVIKVFNGA